MTALVLDCSIAVAWCFEDEITPEIDALADRVRQEGAVVPSLWHLEVGNALLQAVRRGRIATAALQTRVEALAELPIVTDEETTRRAWREVLALALAERLTTYDAAYLELAARRGLPLATKDADLRAAARSFGVPLLPD